MPGEAATTPMNEGTKINLQKIRTPKSQWLVIRICQIIRGPQIIGMNINKRLSNIRLAKINKKIHIKFCFNDFVLNPASFAGAP